MGKTHNQEFEPTQNPQLELRCRFALLYRNSSCTFRSAQLKRYVYRNSAAADEADEDYVYVSPDSLKYFSLAE